MPVQFYVLRPMKPLLKTRPASKKQGAFFNRGKEMRAAFRHTGGCIPQSAASSIPDKDKR